MSGSVGAGRIDRADVDATVKHYEKNVLSKVPQYQGWNYSGSFVSDMKKMDFGDIDLIVHFNAETKPEAKSYLIAELEKNPNIFPFEYKGKTKKYYNAGELLSIKYKIPGKDAFVQIDNIFALDETEVNYKRKFLDLPAEKQGLLLGIIKVAASEFPGLVKEFGLPDLPGDVAFNASPVELQFRDANNKPVWRSKNWEDTEKILKKFGIKNVETETFDSLMMKIKKLSPRSQKRIAGLFKAMISIKSGEVGTPKGDNKQKHLDIVKTLESFKDIMNNTILTESLPRSTTGFTLENKSQIRKQIMDVYTITPDEVTFSPTTDINVAIGYYNKFFDDNPKDARALFHYTMKGVGPGEILFYFLFDKAELAGSSETGDLRLGNSTIEIKAAKIAPRTGMVTDFFILGSDNVTAMEKFRSNIKKYVKTFREALPPDILEQPTEISAAKLNTLRNFQPPTDRTTVRALLTKAGNIYDLDAGHKLMSFKDFAKGKWNSLFKSPSQFKDFGDVEQEFIKSMKSDHDYLFLDIKTGKAIGTLSKERLSDVVQIQRITQGKVKPMIPLEELE